MLASDLLFGSSCVDACEGDKEYTRTLVSSHVVIKAGPLLEPPSGKRRNFAPNHLTVINAGLVLVPPLGEGRDFVPNIRSD